MIRPGPFFKVLYYILYTSFDICFFCQVKHIKECAGDILLLEVWTDDNTNEWNILPVEFMLMNLMVE